MEIRKLFCFPLEIRKKWVYNSFHMLYAGVMELVDVPHSKCGGEIRAGSSPATGTIKSKRYRCHWQKASGINRFRAF